MRHGKKINHLGRTASHRKAMLSNMATSLIQNKRIVTTVAKAKALRKYVEPIINRSKTDTTHSRRMVFRYLQDKESVNILFNEVSERVADRDGGYTRILKTGNRLGDNASMCVIELVDFNESMLKESKSKRSRTRRGRRGKGSAQAESVAGAAVAAAATQTTETEAVVEEAEQVVEETAEAAVAVVETQVDAEQSAQIQTDEEE
jgi:large subunit ribosomal protein L17